MTRLLPILLIAIAFCSCRKEVTDAGNTPFVRISVDTLRFDTVFTGMVSVTKTIRIYNQENGTLRLNRIELKGGSASAFKVNINGNPASLVENEVLDPGDSLLVFVQVQILPTADKQPFAVRDSIRIESNRSSSTVQIQAFGQNAHVLSNGEISGTETWTNDLPYLINGRLHITETGKLTIQKGVRVFCHDKSIVQVDGQLDIDGGSEEANRVLFTGDRLDEPYRYLPGAWQGIRFGSTARAGRIRWLQLMNATDGITFDNTSNAILIENSVIDNCKKAGIRSINASFNIDNCLISNNGQALVVNTGSRSRIRHCTLVGYSNQLVQREDPLVSIRDNSLESATTGQTNIIFQNCIVWGDPSFNGVDIALERAGLLDFAIRFQSSLLSTDPGNQAAVAADCLIGQAPIFKNTIFDSGEYDFHLAEGSPAIDAGSSTEVATDLDNNIRTLPDLGCYEFLP